MVLLPISFTANGTDTLEVKEQILQLILRRLTLSLPPSSRAMLGGDEVSLKPSFTRSYGTAEFATDFNAFRGNAFGLANTMQQSLLWRPSLDGRASNMVFAGYVIV
jgi:phytoene desaturase